MMSNYNVGLIKWTIVFNFDSLISIMSDAKYCLNTFSVLAYIILFLLTLVSRSEKKKKIAIIKFNVSNHHLCLNWNPLHILHILNWCCYVSNWHFDFQFSNYNILFFMRKTRLICTNYYASTCGTAGCVGCTI